MSRHPIQCRDLCKRFGGFEAVRGVDLDVSPGELLTLVGPSGCGKTTLLRLLAGFEAPDRGTITIGPRTIAGPSAWVPPEARRVGMVFQDFALFPHLTVKKNIAYGLPRGPGRRRRVDEMLELVGLGGLGDRLPNELSGGQQQRVALARALAPRPEVLLLDEPFSNLDPSRRGRVREEVRAILRHEGVTALLVTHDQDEAMAMGDRVAVMDHGLLEQVDTPEGLYERPASPLVARFIGLADFLVGRLEGDRCRTELGECAIRLPGRPRGLPDGSVVEVVVRPDDLAIRPPLDGDPGGPNGVILDRTFLGMHCLYRVRLEGSGRTVRALAPHTCRWERDARVVVRAEPGHPLVGFPADWEAIEGQE